MDYKTFHTKLFPLYATYNESIKFLIAHIELLYEKFPTPIFNEIRAFNDHIARCYTEPLDESIVEEQIPKAKSHIERILLDCYKYVNTELRIKTIDEFDRRTRNVDIKNISNGEFYLEYKNKDNGIAKKLKDAKLLESIDKAEALSLYEEAFNSLCDLEDFLNEYRHHINWAIAKFRINKTMTILGWLVTIIGSILGILAFFFSWEQVVAIFHSFWANQNDVY